MVRIMKTVKIIIIICIGVIGFCVQGCNDDLLSGEPEGLLVPENFMSTQKGVQQVLLGAYRHLANSNGNNRGEIGIAEYSTDILYQHGGGENGYASQVINFTLGPELDQLPGTFWEPNWRAIRNSNIVLENLGIGDYPEVMKSLFQAEARFIRAVAYYKLYRAFGPVPLRTSTDQELELPKVSEEELRQFIETELLEIIPNLPFSGEESEYGRAHIGAARAYLTKFYLNTHQWEKSASMAQELIDMGYYSLFPEFPGLFKVENEMNREFIWVDQIIVDNIFSQIFSAVIPPGFARAEPDHFAKTNDEGIEMMDSWIRIASQYALYDSFVNSFEPEDDRQQLILVEYINQDGDTIDLLSHEQPDARPFKFWPDPNGVDRVHGNDYPQIRYADILLSRAEALNEMDGPNQESIDLINEVRNRAGLDDLLLSDFLTTEELRNHFIDERGWEFYLEGIRRFDLIRFGVFIEKAHERGINNAQPHHVRYPIPQSAIDANPNLEQNSGY